MRVVDLISCLDLTSLNDTDTEERINILCDKAVTPFGNVAAVCIYPQFVPFAVKKLKNTGVKVATVVNFPEGNRPIEVVISEIKEALTAGADEIDAVIPYVNLIMHGAKKTVADFVVACHKASGTAALKIILETGALSSSLITDATRIAIDNGADFVKTSTGKIKVGATPEAARLILKAIKNSNKKVGFKVSGGVRTVEDAMVYAELAMAILQKETLTPDIFRIGASQLLDAIMEFENE